MNTCEICFEDHTTQEGCVPFSCGACGLIYTKEQANTEGFHKPELCEEAN